MPAETQSTLTLTLMALADPTRRAIIERLARGEACVTEIAHPFNHSLNAISKHIRVLERARLVRRRRQGKEHLLSVIPESFDEATRWMARQRTFWTGRLNFLENLLRAEDREVGRTRIKTRGVHRLP